MGEHFRDFLFAVDSPRLAPFRGMDAAAFGRAAREAPVPAGLIREWEERSKSPFHGVTVDGALSPGLFALADQGAPVEAMASAAWALLEGLSDGERAQLCYRLDAPEWRRWSNPEFLVNPNGLRLEEVSPGARELILSVLRASLGAPGYRKARGCMQVNAFLGELCQLPRIMNEWSYNFLLFGEPSVTAPWGWSLYGHHLVLNCFVLGGQMVLTPTFMGAEPNIIDEGPLAGLTLFDDEERIGLSLMRSLPADLREKARTYPLLEDPEMPPGRWHLADQRHLGGAFHDNRIIPYEGVCASAFTAGQRDRLMSLVGAFVTTLPEGPREARLEEVAARLDETWWSWIGGWGDEDPFYYRIQSPVIMIEFDHHSGVWLSNQAPAKCHIHTIVRTPNGNDYGRDLLRQHYERVHPGRAPGRD